jgi:hypothetical protein
MMSRYVRAVGDDRRKEIISFYVEPLAVNGHSLDEFPDGDPPTENLDRLSRKVTARGRSAFEVLSREATADTP